MKRIGLITLYKDNYGSELQCYATKHYLESLGFHCDVINEQFVGIDKIYHKIEGWHDTLWKSIRYSDFWKNRKEMKNAARSAQKSLSAVSQKELDYFALTVLQPRYIDHKVLYNSSFKKEYAFFICGSDQVWNGANRISGLRFLEFADDDQKVALSPSFGMGEIKKYNNSKFKREISKFRFLSVREQSGIQIIKNLTGRDVQRLPDPVALLSPEEWGTFSSNSITSESPYLFMHFLDAVSEETIASVNNYAERKKLKIVCFAYPREEYKGLKNWMMLDGGPRDYVGLIKNASYVCTDSFHTTYFSIIFEKQFMTFSRNYLHKNSQASRLETLLKLYRAEERYIDASTLIDIQDRQDTHCFSLILSKERESIRTYLSNVLKAYCEQEIITEKPMLKSYLDCVGCMACADICSAKAITIQYSDLGFKLPLVDRDKCIHCGLCEKVCLGQVHRNPGVPVAAIAFNKNIELQLVSASGGIFSAFARKILLAGGAVVGAELRFENGKPVCKHIIINNINELHRILGSKYVESDMTGVYNEIADILGTGTEVLFGGTSCQVNALYNYLKIKKVNYNHLYTVDLICHGVPGIKLFSDYIELLEEKHKSKVAAFAFRKKENNVIYYKEQIQFGEQIQFVEQIPLSESCYYRLFMRCESYRDQCYHCDFARIDKPADITIGDYFEAREDYPDLFADSASELNHNYINVMIIHNKKGKQLIEKYGSNLYVRNIDIRKVQLSHGQLCIPSMYSYFRIKAKKAYENGGIRRLERTVIHDKKKRKYIDKLKSGGQVIKQLVDSTGVPDDD